MGGPAIAESDSVNGRVTHSYWPGWAAAVWFVAGLLALLSIGACRQGVPVIDPTPGPAEQNGTISGTVRGPEGTSAIEGRVVEAVNVDTGERQRATTNNAGGFTFKVRPGKYRVELTLLEGEKLVKQPSEINVNRSDVDAHADFVISTSRIARPRFAAPRFGNGLGAPIA
jgi:Carboxypeptidase regulatory-like domain